MASIIATERQPGVITLENFFTEEECNHWINFSEENGYEKATINLGHNKHVINTQVRNNERVIYDNIEFAQQLWNKLEPYVIKDIGIAQACSLNERLRFYKYLPGHRFKWHQDGSYIRNIHEWSSFTFMVYLNEEMEGGATKFHGFKVKPKKGMAIIFSHQLGHEGEVITDGVKYVLRSDIMYRRKGY